MICHYYGNRVYDLSLLWERRILSVTPMGTEYMICHSYGNRVYYLSLLWEQSILFVTTMGTEYIICHYYENRVYYLSLLWEHSILFVTTMGTEHMICHYCWSRAYELSLLVTEYMNCYKYGNMVCEVSLYMGVSRWTVPYIVCLLQEVRKMSVSACQQELKQGYGNLSHVIKHTVIYVKS